MRRDNRLQYINSAHTLQVDSRESTTGMTTHLWCLQLSVCFALCLRLSIYTQFVGKMSEVMDLLEYFIY